MNSIGVNNISNQSFQALSSAALPSNDCSAPEIADTVELDCPTESGSETLKATAAEPQEPSAKPQKIKLKDLPKLIAKSKKPDRELVRYAAQHPAITAAVGLGAVATCGVVGTILVGGAGNTIKEVMDLVKQAATMSTLQEKAEVYKQAGKLLGAGAVAGVAVGAAGAGGVAVFKSIEGISDVSKGIKKHDKLKTSRGARKINTGLKGALAAGTIASFGLANTRGTVGTVRAALMPALKVTTSVLNTTVGAFQLAKGIKDKNKKDIIGGALNLGVGVAAGVSMAMGGGIVATACTVFSTARTLFNGANTAIKLHKYAKEARQELKTGAPQDKSAPQDVAKDGKASPSETKTGNVAPSQAPSAQPTQTSANPQVNHTTLADYSTQITSASTPQASTASTPQASTADSPHVLSTTSQQAPSTDDLAIFNLAPSENNAAKPSNRL